jgi:hypothetical protein
MNRIHALRLEQSLDRLQPTDIVPGRPGLSYLLAIDNTSDRVPLMRRLFLPWTAVHDPPERLESLLAR